jgi:hypothetical protein
MISDPLRASSLQDPPSAEAFSTGEFAQAELGHEGLGGARGDTPSSSAMMVAETRGRASTISMRRGRLELPLFPAL